METPDGVQVSDLLSDVIACQGIFLKLAQIGAVADTGHFGAEIRRFIRTGSKRRFHGQGSQQVQVMAENQIWLEFCQGAVQRGPEGSENCSVISGVRSWYRVLL